MKDKIGLTCSLLAISLFGCFQTTIAQEKEVKQVNLIIAIHNGDTIVNGKSFKNISEKERVALRKNFDNIQIESKAFPDGPRKIVRRMTVTSNDNKMGLDSNITKSIVITTDDDSQNVIMLDSSMQQMVGDKDHKMIIIKRDQRDAKGLTLPQPPQPPHARMEFRPLNGDLDQFHPGMDNEHIEIRMAAPNGEMSFGEPQKLKKAIGFNMPNLPNTNTYNFATTDKNGFTTKTNFTIAEPFKEELKVIFKDENTAIDALHVEHLLLFPNFSNGTTMLSFSLSAKAIIEVKMLDADGKVLFVEKKSLINDHFSKWFNLSKNGIYYLHVKQGNQTFIRKVIKE
jgi:hypothetical protein